jgi:hypothetical protein
MSKRSAVAALLGTAVLSSVALPASALSDTQPPQLVSFSVTPTQVDPSSSAQTVTVTAVITDDLSGVSEDAEVDVYSPSGNQESYGFFTRVSGDTFSANVSIAMFAEAGIWRDWYIYLYDNVGNSVEYDEYDLISRNINVAVGVGSYSSSYHRTISLKLRRTQASGTVDTNLASACFWYVPVLLERKTKSGWRHVAETLSDFNGKFRIAIHKRGTYRATATPFAIGTPTLTMCSRASVVRAN